MRRKERYLGKINFILSKIENLPEFDNDLLRDACFYRIQVAIGAGMDIVAMLVKDIGKEIKDDYSNIETLVKEEILDKELGKKMIELNGLRNVIVHKYNKIEEEIIKEKKEMIVSILEQFVEKVENVIEKIL
ncbi:MAG TPA: DUF86 domain-containing protein [Candidatus Aenigmarchaeota archaeon]|nr:DUF86 domain-containing protein [Candidatus Aenigmarchaeota archaeon]